MKEEQEPELTETTESSYFSQKGPSDHFVRDGPKFMSTPPKLCIHNISDPLKNVLDFKNGHLKNIKPGQFNGKDLPNWHELGRIGATAAIPLMRVSVCVCAHGYLCVCVCEEGSGGGCLRGRAPAPSLQSIPENSPLQQSSLFTLSTI